MKTKQILSCVPFMFVLVTGCTWDSSSPVSPFWPSTSVKHKASAYTNGEIIQELMVIDKAEVAAAKVAQRRAQHASVKRYANLMSTEHTKCLNKLMHFSHTSGIKPVMSMNANNVEAHGKAELAQLETVSNKDFDKTYMDNMIQDHRAALQTLDQAIAHATNPKLTHILKDARHHVAMHLHKAEKIQKRLH
ncbi:MAG TPA: DUF4142 domain-containing protein [Legionellaceae bacterium]|nr:DUF4142 domain-containing protein [Legionellaceae bacterium]